MFIRSPPSRPFFIRADKGADPFVHLATTSDEINGKYFHRFTVAQPRNRQAVDAELAQRLWTMSEEITGTAGPAK